MGPLGVPRALQSRRDQQENWHPVDSLPNDNIRTWQQRHRVSKREGVGLFKLLQVQPSNAWWRGCRVTNRFSPCCSILHEGAAVIPKVFHFRKLQCFWKYSGRQVAVYRSVMSRCPGLSFVSNTLFLSTVWRQSRCRNLPMINRGLSELRAIAKQQVLSVEWSRENYIYIFSIFLKLFCMC